jgi:ligand-binding SRPBCC domain-containing protein
VLRVKSRIYECEQWLPAPRGDVFAFFSDARNLNTITPPWLNFRILTQGPLDVYAGAQIDYRITLRAIPMRWRTRITLWQPDDRFIDEQVRGPYRRWVHLHTFEDQRGGTHCRDRVEYAHLGGPLIERCFVRPEIERIFAYRREVMARLFSVASPPDKDTQGVGVVVGPERGQGVG